MSEKTATRLDRTRLRTGVPTARKCATQGQEAARGPECTQREGHNWGPPANSEASPASCPGTGVSELTPQQAERAPAQVCRARTPATPKPPF